MLKLSFVLEAIDKATAITRRVNKTINSITAPARRVRESLASLGRESGLQRIVTTAGTVRERFGGIARDLRGLRTMFLYVAGAAAAFAFPLKRAIDSASQINDAAAMLGLTARDLQRVSFALTLDGSSMEEAAVSLRFLQRNAVEALTGSQEMTVWFRRAGISADFLSKNLKNPKALLYAIADGLASAKTPAQRLAIAQALLGRSGGKLVQTLARGSKEMERLGDMAEALGAVLDDKTVAAMDTAGDTITIAGKAVHGLMALIAAGALPVIQDITEGVIEWVKANRELIKTEAAKFFKQLRDNLPAIWENIKRVTAAIFDIIGAVNRVVQFFGGWDNVLKAIAVLITAKVLVSLAQLAFAIKGLGIVLLTTPLGLLLTGLAGLAALGLAVYNKWNPALGVLENLKSILEDTILLLDDLTPKWSRFVNPLSAGVVKTAERIRAARATVAGLGPVNTSALVGDRAPESIITKKRPVEVGGRLDITIDTARELRPFIRKIESDNNDVPIEVSFGPVTALPR